MQTLRIAAVLGLVGAAVALGLAYAWSAVSGHPITGEEVLRHVMISFLVAGCVVGVLRGGRVRRS